MVDNKVLKTQLKNKNDYSLVKLASKNNVTISEIIAALLSILRNETSKLKDVNDLERNKYLFKIISLLDRVSDKEDLTYIKNNLEDIKRICARRKTSVGKSKVLDRLMLEIDAYFERAMMKREENVSSVAQDILNNIIFELKDLDYLKIFLKENPEKMAVKHNDKLYIEELIDQYILELITENHDEYLYLENVLKALIKSEKLEIDKNSRKKVIRRLYGYMDEIDQFNITDDQKEKELYHLNEVINYFDKNNYTNDEMVLNIYDLLRSLDLSKLTVDAKAAVEENIQYLSDLVINENYNLNDINKINRISLEIGKMAIDPTMKYALRRLCSRVIKYLQSINIPKKKYECIDYKYDINASNSEALKKLSNIITYDGKDVIDCTDKFTISIDNAGTNIYDDAISLDSYKDGTKVLGIYLADVPSYVKRGDLVDITARHQAESIFAPRKRITMLPEELSIRLSLTENMKKHATGYFFIFGPNGQLIEFKVAKCLIKVDKNFDYDEANELLIGPTSNPEIKFLKNMREMADKVDVCRTIEYRQLKNLRKQALDSEPYDLTTSSNMIFNFMVFLNTYIADFFAKHPEIPFIYRNNLSKFNQELIDRLIKDAGNDDIYKEVIKNTNKVYYRPSYYSTINDGYTGFNNGAYCHASNPIRNYCSLEIGRIVDERLIKRNMEIIEGEREYLENLCVELNDRREINEMYVREAKELILHR